VPGSQTVHPHIVRPEERRTIRFDDPEYRIRYTSADIGRHFGVDRIALHHFMLEPGCRTSMPHAESAEEEFVLVIKGSPSVWIDGELFALEEGDFVGFPSGTGTAHTFINNGAAVCELLVGGEKTKPNNRCSFPVNPEMAHFAAGIWWADAPVVTRGAADPMPQHGRIGTTEISRRPACIRNWRFVREHLPFSYPTCTVRETFSRGRDLTTATGLQVCGVWLDRIPAGKRSSWPHAHRFEEELFYVVEGSASVWVNGEETLVTAGDFFGFKSGTGDVHTVVNRGQEDALLFVLGERLQEYTEQLFYSHHPAQNELNRTRGRLWEDRPETKLGPVDPGPGAGGSASAGAGS
jgi:uncharacterized cupin superfamily protein